MVPYGTVLGKGIADFGSLKDKLLYEHVLNHTVYIYMYSTFNVHYVDKKFNIIAIILLLTYFMHYFRQIH